MQVAHTTTKTEQKSGNDQQARRPLRWFLLAWESLVYFWALLYLNGVNPITLEKAQTGQTPVPVGAVSPNAPIIALFTALMLAQGGLLWIGLSGKLPRRLTWLYFCIQGALVFSIGLIVQQDNVVLNLYLALILGAIAMLRQARYVLAVALGYVVLFLTSSQSWSFFAWSGASQYLRVLWTKSDYAAMLLLVVGFIVLYLQQVRVHNQLASAHEQLQASAERIEELTLVAERRRLARELHDTLAQGVAGLIMQLEAANAQLGQQRLQVVEDILHQAMASARGTLVDARSVIDNLRTISSCGDFRESVEEEIRRFTIATGITCRAVLPALDQVPALLYEHAFRTICEGLNNVARHAQAREAIVRIVMEGNVLVIEVRDDGIGFEPEVSTRRAGHYGLIGLRERARLAGGMLDVNSAPGAGTTLRLLLPFSATGGGSTWALPSAS